MPRLSEPRGNELLTLSDGRSVPFSFYPLASGGGGRPKAQSVLYASDPWNPMLSRVQQLSDAGLRDSCLVLIAQAIDYYEAAEAASTYEAKPTLYYYSLLNAIKPLLAIEGKLDLGDRQFHGLSDITLSGSDFRDGSVKRKNGVFPRLVKYLRGSSPKKLTVSSLAPQVLTGHRFWLDAEGLQQECYVRIKKIGYVVDYSKKWVWLYFEINRNAPKQCGITQSRLPDETGLGGLFKQVKPIEAHHEQNRISYELLTYRKYSVSPTEKIRELNDLLAGKLWRTIHFVDPYRKYYLHVASKREAILPQLASQYALMFLFGSITRYDTGTFRSWIDGRYGSFIREFITGQPRQTLYELASAYAGREVVQSSIS